MHDASVRNTWLQPLVQCSNRRVGIVLGFAAIFWEGEGLNEVGKRGDTGETVVKIDPIYFRPSEVNSLIGNSKKAEERLGWKPKISLEEMVLEMIEKDKENAKNESFLKSRRGLDRKSFKNISKNS